jgi:uncharacterized FlaG/YvyC family protein
MASDGISVKIPAASLVHGSQAPTSATIHETSGKALPPSGKAAAAQSAVAAAQAAKSHQDAQALVAQLNKVLNDSGRPDQYRLDPSSNNKVIQQINPASGAVIGEFLVSEFPALARSVGVTGQIVDSHA